MCDKSYVEAKKKWRQWHFGKIAWQRCVMTCAKGGLLRPLSICSRLHTEHALVGALA